jgi:hypothetical protein
MASDLQRSPTRPVQQNHADSNDFCDLISPETPSVVSSRIMQASTQTVTLSSNTTSGTASVTVNTSAASSAAVVRPKLRERQGWGAAGESALIALLLFLWPPAQLRKWRRIFGVLALIALFGLMTACGGVGTTQQTNPGTTAGTYTIMITGTGNDSANTTATTTFTLTVN